MAVFNIVRGRARLSQAEFGVACTLGQDPGDSLLQEAPAQACLEELERARLAQDGALSGYLAELVSVVLAPKLRVVAEVTVGRMTAVHSVWSDESLAVFGAASGDDEIELIPLEPMMLPWALALNLNLGNRPYPEISAPVELRSSALDQAFNLVDEGHRAEAVGSLRNGSGMSDSDAEKVVRLLECQHISWRASSVWTDETGHEQTRTVTVVDGGMAGLWLTHSTGQETEDVSEDSTLALTPTNSETIWSELVDLFPSLPAPFTATTERL